MAESEKLPENTALEQSEIVESAAGTTAEEESATVASASDDVQDTAEKSVITELQATIKIEGQEFELEAELAQDDKLLKTILQPHFASVENANITRDVHEGKLTVTIVKKAQHKGACRPGSRYLLPDRL